MTNKFVISVALIVVVMLFIYSKRESCFTKWTKAGFEKQEISFGFDGCKHK